MSFSEDTDHSSKTASILMYLTGSAYGVMKTRLRQTPS